MKGPKPETNKVDLFSPLFCTVDMERVETIPRICHEEFKNDINRATDEDCTP